jgi:uncharacterized membrane protein HdeD (DUF308 family)
MTDKETETIDVTPTSEVEMTQAPAEEPSRTTITRTEPTPVISDMMRKLLAAAGIVAIVLGLIAFIFGGQTLPTVSVIFGLFSIFTAVVDILLFRNSRLLRGSHLMSALLSVVMGLVLLFRQDVTNEFAGMIFGFWILFNAAGNLAQSWVSEMLIGWQRLVGLLIGLAGLVIGLYLALFTTYDANTLGILVGLYADLLGIFFLLTAFFSRKK